MNFVVIVSVVKKMITTKTGDKGQTSCGNKRVNKDDLLVEVVGEIDELQAVLELIKVDKKFIDDLNGIMGELSCGIKYQVSSIKYRIKQMEKEIEKNNLNLNKFLKFKNEEALKLNWVRTICRRVERRIVSLSKKQKVNEDILVYFNRFSDYLFLKAVIIDSL